MQRNKIKIKSIKSHLLGDFQHNWNVSFITSLILSNWQLKKPPQPVSLVKATSSHLLSQYIQLQRKQFLAVWFFGHTLKHTDLGCEMSFLHPRDQTHVPCSESLSLNHWTNSGGPRAGSFYTLRCHFLKLPHSPTARPPPYLSTELLSMFIINPATKSSSLFTIFSLFNESCHSFSLLGTTHSAWGFGLISQFSLHTTL